MLSGIDIIVISIDGASQESYSKYRVGGDLTTVLDNTEKLLSYRDNVQSPLLIWQFLVNRFNESEIERAENMAQKMGIQFNAAPMRTSMGKELLLPLYERVQEIADWLPANTSFHKYAYEITPETKTKQEFCRWLWNTAVVNWDGSVSPCCGVFEKKWDFHSYDTKGGNSPFRRVWNSPRYRLARKLVSAYMKKSSNLNLLLRHSEKEGLICSKCIHYGFLED
jgi:MoaA/NifB/PqqE/SkfB family radical SAM enzyme